MRYCCLILFCYASPRFFKHFYCGDFAIFHGIFRKFQNEFKTSMWSDVLRTFTKERKCLRSILNGRFANYLFCMNFAVFVVSYF